MRRQCGLRSRSLVIASAFLLAACAEPEIPLGEIGNVEGPLGGAASDEPRATLVAEDILASGGTAADAATAMYFTLAVTYPIAASLGGGGECLVYDIETNKLENLQFPNTAPAAGGTIAIPGNIRGMTALQARYGRLAWTSILSPAEKIANFGEPLSRAQHMAMVLNSDQLLLDFNLNTIFREENGEFVAEGTKIRQIRLASLLSALRSEGGAAFYGGNWARTFVEDVSNAGGNITLPDMVNYKPVWLEARTFEVDNNTVGVSAGRSGEIYRDLWLSLFEGKGFLGIDQEIELAEVAKNTVEIFDAYQNSALFISNGTTSFVTSDSRGNAVACVVGVKRPFGTGRIGEITGIVLSPNIPAEESEFLTSPMLIVNLPNKDFYYGSAATGGAAATPASISTALSVTANDKDLDSAIQGPRLFATNPGLPLLYESSMGQEDINNLKQNFPILVEVDRLASVNAIYCRDGKVPNCVSRHDPRGYGLSIIEN
ncbi:MAG: gamma-glutamyltransferase family protein [Proteobacteria bacterium]|nr:gamma-glutamyltransferase family protein [Pseudomonadota bacterium]